MLDTPPDHVADLDGLDPTVRGELESIGIGRIDPHRDARTDVLHEELAGRVRVNPHVATLVVDRGLIAIEPVLRRCRCGLCHVAPPLWLVNSVTPEWREVRGTRDSHPYGFYLLISKL